MSPDARLAAGIAIFAVTYLLIAGRRLRWLPIDRPAGALLGAVLMVAAGVLGPHEALKAVDYETLLLLFGLMGIGGFLAIDGFLDRAAAWMAARCGTRRRLLGAMVWGAGALAALITNDAVCVLGAPLVLAWVRRLGLPPLPFFIGLATAANTGSVATLVGNPQNMLCGRLGGLDYGDFLLRMAPVAVAGLAINHGLLLLLFRRELDGPLPAAPAERIFDGRSAFTLTVLAGTVIAGLAGADLAWTAAGGFTLLLAGHRRETSGIWTRVDWTVLVFFAGLFVAVGGFTACGASARVLARAPLSGSPDAATSAFFLLGSNLFSNVPFILVVADGMARFDDPRLAWELLAMASTFAGNLTLLGSVANIIVAEKARETGGMGFWAYLRVGAPVALLTTALGTAWLLALR
jgi:Na+/H+ antiporter NhaD/arsenite permease-like protein